MKPFAKTWLTLASCAALSACTMIQTSRVTDPDAAPRGVRVYTPRIYLLVDNEVKPAAQSYVLTLPDFCRAYDVQPLTILAKQDFKIELDDGGQVKALTAFQDTTAALSFIKEAATLAAKAAGAAVGLQTISGTFGLPSGVYRVGDNGSLQMLYAKGKAPVTELVTRCP